MTIDVRDLIDDGILNIEFWIISDLKRELGERSKDSSDHDDSILLIKLTCTNNCLLSTIIYFDVASNPTSYCYNLNPCNDDIFVS